MAETTPKKAPRKPTGRSRVTNGKLGDMDGRGKWARRLADLIELYGQDICANPATLPHTVQNLIRRAATITVELERAEAGFAKAGEASPSAFSDYQTGCNTLRRLLQDLQVQMKIPEHLDRPGRSRNASVDGGLFVKGITSGFSPGDWRLATGPLSDRELARAIAFQISEAVRLGIPLHPETARLAVDAGLVEYDYQHEGNVIDLTDHRH